MNKQNTLRPFQVQPGYEAEFSGHEYYLLSASLLFCSNFYDIKNPVSVIADGVNINSVLSLVHAHIIFAFKLPIFHASC